MKDGGGRLAFGLLLRERSQVDLFTVTVSDTWRSTYIRFRLRGNARKRKAAYGKQINSRMVCTQTRDHDHVRGDPKAGLLVLACPCPCSNTEPIKYGINIPNKMKMMRDFCPSSSADTSGDAWWETGCRTVATYRKLPPCRQFALKSLIDEKRSSPK